MDPAEIASRLRQALPSPLTRALEPLVSLASEAGVPLYAVGGCVRDVLLAGRPVDLDLVVDGDAIPLAEALAARLDAPLRRHPYFLTATLTPDGVTLDLATSRRERYPRPGALPVVEPAPITQDLGRRDFSINAMALRLTGEPALLDPLEGQADLSRRLVRVLHEQSFQDDATRMIRAVRYAGRLGFEIEARTLDLFRRDRPFLATISGSRLLRELELVLGEPPAARILEGCARLGLLRCVHPALRLPSRLETALADRPPDVDPLAFGLALLLRDARQPVIRSALARLQVRGRQALPLMRIPSARRTLEQLDAGLPPSWLTALLEPLPPVTLAAVALTAPDSLARDLALRYLREWRQLRPELDGSDLHALGVPPGPATGRMVRALRNARIDGLVHDRAGEEALVRTMLQDGPGT